MRAIRRSDWIWLGCALAVLALFHLTKGNRAIMNAVASATAPVKRGLAAACALVPFSVMELFVALFFACALFWLFWTIRGILRRSAPQGPAALGAALRALCAGLTVYAALCLMWGVNYYADSFQIRAGLVTQPAPVERLAAVTRLFARRVAETSVAVKRDEEGRYAEDLDEIFAAAVTVYDRAEAEWPFLAYPRPVPPKPLLSSLLFSRTNYTGMYFPFTGEANINVHSPGCLIPATIAHEMAHQRGVAAEDEANFAAIVAATGAPHPAYAYSGWLLGYIHLVNALYLRSPEAYAEVYDLLSPEAVLDLRENSDYWARFESKLADVSEEIYDGFLKGYGQALGTESYGAVVDLLLVYFYDEA